MRLGVIGYRLQNFSTNLYCQQRNSTRAAAGVLREQHSLCRHTHRVECMPR